MLDHVDLVIFDCDGVLVDSEVLAVEVDKRICAEFGWELSTEEVVDRFLGRPASHFCSQLEEHLGRKLPLDWEEKYQPWYDEAFDAHLQAVPGIEAALDQLEFRTCVASSGSHEKIRKTLGHTGLLRRFEGRIFSSSEVLNGKPAPDIFLHAAHRLGHQPENCVVVEDSKYGVRAARAAGMRVFGYAGGLTPASWLEAEGATVFTSMAELPGMLH
ncbi:HAD family phosphatase [Rathayibacter tritici]|uniref:Haloacid dehalogenase n=1 Tax=Rathayibacter tritici TaxID=33888 RepID=A0A161IYQ9_9MICO|nr:HAD family phosphatase [Rathayibacter tritici]AND15661.1 haloacid dehalogenase [Rathayibacter tritici]PPF30957.1 HAD family phosphatase [Rathayibacter tritici]PPF64683.1 HAD family phosphatase [Rathayibacter tritici]PPG04752.1 HAD family phosphatase [Rathayibacter tritici]PPI16795.1 HAD family phosphatase [Rathayibacter tritici]